MRLIGKVNHLYLEPGRVVAEYTHNNFLMYFLKLHVIRIFMYIPLALHQNTTILLIDFEDSARFKVQIMRR